MENYLLLAGAVLLLALDNVVRKRYQVIAGTSMTAGLFFNVFLGLTAAALFFALNGFQWESTPYSLIMAFTQALLGVAYTILGFRIMKESIALYALFLMTGGMVIPYVWGLLFLGEQFSWLRMAGLVLIIAAVILARGQSARANSKLLFLCAVVFFLNGFVSVITKEHQMQPADRTISAMGFAMMVNFAKMVLSGAAQGAAQWKTKPRPAQPPFLKTFPLICLCTLLGGTAYYLQLLAAGKVSASVMFPMMTGGTIIASALMARIFYKEKPSRRAWLGILLCFAGTLLFL